MERGRRQRKMPFQLQNEEIRRKRGKKTIGTASRGRETYLLCEGVMVLEGFAD